MQPSQFTASRHVLKSCNGGVPEATANDIPQKSFQKRTTPGLDSGRLFIFKIAMDVCVSYIA